VWLDSVPLASRLHGALSQFDLVAQTPVSRDDVWFEKFPWPIFCLGLAPVDDLSVQSGP
jgi:hypothetical protein